MAHKLAYSLALERMENGAAGHEHDRILMHISMEAPLLLVLLSTVQPLRCGDWFFNSRFMRRHARTLVHRSSEMYQHTELTHQYPTAFEKHTVVVSYGLADQLDLQVSRPWWWGRRFAFPWILQHISVFWYMGFEGYVVHWWNFRAQLGSHGSRLLGKIHVCKHIHACYTRGVNIIYSSAGRALVHAALDMLHLHAQSESVITPLPHRIQCGCVPSWSDHSFQAHNMW